jgi:hypothetical protein
MTQTLYAHMNKIKIKKKEIKVNSCIIESILCIEYDFMSWNHRLRRSSIILQCFTKMYNLDQIMRKHRTTQSEAHSTQ